MSYSSITNGKVKNVTIKYNSDEINSSLFQVTGFSPKENHGIVSLTAHYEYESSCSSLSENEESSGIGKDISTSKDTDRAMSNLNTLSSPITESERSILECQDPIEINECEEITVDNFTGLWYNRKEVETWQGDLPISEYKINNDPNPQIITKKIQSDLEYYQELAIRYLRPPTPPTPGDINIIIEQDIITDPAPPIIIRQEPEQPQTPTEPIIFREAPPAIPPTPSPIHINIPGKRLSPPPRKVVIERFEQIEKKPKKIFIDRWLPYERQKRKVFFNKKNESEIKFTESKNVIVQWEAPQVNITQAVKYLGVIDADPEKYQKTYGMALKCKKDLPKFVKDIQIPIHIEPRVLPSEKSSDCEFEDDFFDDDLSGYGDNLKTDEYRKFIASNELTMSDITTSEFTIEQSIQFPHSADDEITMEHSVQFPLIAKNESSSTCSYGTETGTTIEEAATKIFNIVDNDGRGSISVEEAADIFLRLNVKLKRSYDAVQVKHFFMDCSNGTGEVTMEQFLAGMQQMLVF